MRSIKHWTPDYIVARLAVLNFRRRTGEPLPMFATGAIQFLGSYLTKEDRVFEYGSGYSTLWLARHAGCVVSVEDNAEWYARIAPELRAFGNAKLSLFAANGDPSPPPPERWGYEKYVVSEAYVYAIKSYPPAFFDLVIIDGQARVHTALAALPHLRPSGVLCWDDFAPASNGPTQPEGAAAQFAALTRDWRHGYFNDGAHQTALFFKPG